MIKRVTRTFIFTLGNNSFDLLLIMMTGKGDQNILSISDKNGASFDSLSNQIVGSN